MENLSLREELLRIALDRYGTEPDYPWEKAPRHAVLRHENNRKWYAVVMNIPKNRLGFSESGNIDIVNVKADPYIIGSLRLTEGIFPAYHMNKANWITIILDGTVAMEKITSLLDMSFEMTSSWRQMKSRKKKTARDKA